MSYVIFLIGMFQLGGSIAALLLTGTQANPLIAAISFGFGGVTIALAVIIHRMPPARAEDQPERDNHYFMK